MENLKPNPANSCPMTPLGFLERAATVDGDSAAVIYNDSVQTWSETHRRCLRVASSIVSTLAGDARGKIVSVVAPNIPAMYELHFAVPMAGAILNTINTRLNARTISVMLRHSASALIFVDQLSADLVLAAVSLFPAHAHLPRLVLVEDHSEPENRVNATLRTRFGDTYEEMATRGDPEFRWVRPESEWDPMILNYTSGTTSSPKGVVHCHRGIFTVAMDSIVNWNVPKNPVFLWTLPMFHANGWSFPWGTAALGGTNICLRRFDAGDIFRAIRRHGVTHMCGAPVVLNMLSNSPAAERLRHPVHVMTAGAPPPAAVLHRTEDLGFVVFHGYGLTETAGVVISCAWKRGWDGLPAGERARMKARQGVRTAGTAEVDVVDPTSGASVAKDGESLGEIVVRGSGVMMGYLKDPRGTAKAISSSGWFFTGDVGVIHPDGYLEIKDRSKDVIISGGENVSSVEVESVLYGHPAVDEAAVVARPDAFWGETPCAFVTLKSGETTTEDEILQFCRRKLPRYMSPRSVVFRDELPKTSTGKIQKFILKDIAKSMGSATVIPQSRI